MNSDIGNNGDRSRVTLEKVAEAIITIDPSGIVIDFNPAAEQMLGYGADEVIGNNVKMLMPQPYVDEHDDYLKKYLDTGTAKIIGADGREVEARRKDGSVIPVELGVSEAFVGGQRFFVGVLKDISDHRRSRLALEDSNALLGTLSRMQARFIANIGAEPGEVFDEVLAAAISLTSSELGFIGEVRGGDSGAPYLRLFAVNNVLPGVGNLPTDDGEVLRGVELRDNASLLGVCLMDGEPVMLNDIETEGRPIGLPGEHRPVHSLLCAPFYKGPEMVGLMGIANREAGYDVSQLLLLEPVLSTAANIITAWRNDLQRREAVEALSRSEESLKQAQAIAHIGSWSRHLKTNELIWSDEVFRIMGQTPSGGLPDYRAFIESIPPTQRKGMADAVAQTISTGDSYRYEHQVVLPDGRQRDVLEIGELVLDETGNPEKLIGIVHDITEQKLIDRMKTEFISTVSHELRTPLTSINGSLGLLAGGVAGDITGQALKLIEIASNNSERLVRLINDILDIEKIESGQMVFHDLPLDVMQLVRTALESNQSFADQHGVDLVLIGDTGDARIAGDRDRMTQVFANLISNACKFSAPGMTVEIRVALNGNVVRIEIADTGRGIPDDFHKRMYQKFAQADSSDSRRFGGTGLGLSIVKSILDNMNGTIEFETELDKGTTFIVELPRLQTALPRKSAEPSSRGLRLLVCEDDRDTAILLQLMLEKEGYAVDLADSAEEARALIAGNDYHAMTLDIGLPGESGVSLIDSLRSHSATARLPIVVVSASAAKDHSGLTGDAFSIVDWIRKPIDENRLIEAVRSAGIDRHKGRPNILHIEDDRDLVVVVEEMLAEIADVTPAATNQEAVNLLRARSFDLIILDIELPDGSGLDLLPVIGRHSPAAPIMVFSAHEFTSDTSELISQSLVKSRTSNSQLVESIKTLLKRYAPVE